jgi:hypothetical protein
MITQARLKELLHYDPDTGVFTRLIATNRNVRIGDVAGSLNTHHSGKKYWIIGILRKKFAAHRLAWLYVHGEMPANQIDHKDGDGSNNRISNLRAATSQENQRNRRLSVNNSSGVIGVYWIKRDSVWMVSITVDYEIKNLGSFQDKFEAICARKSAETRYGFYKNHGQNRPC